MSTNISNNYKLRGSLSIVLNSRTVLTELTEIYRGGKLLLPETWLWTWRLLVLKTLNKT